MADHVTAVCRAAYFHLRQLRLSVSVLSVSVDAEMTLVQSFISCHLDYCNSLFTGITDSLLGCLQSVQNAAARLVTGTRRRDQSTLLQCWGNSTGFRSDNESTSSWLSWSTRRFTIQLQRILSTTVSSSLTLAVAGYDRPTWTRVVFHGPTHGSATGALQPLDRGFGTVCQPGFASPTMRIENFVGS